MRKEIQNPAKGLLNGDEMRKGLFLIWRLKSILIGILFLAIIVGLSIFGYVFIAGDNKEENSETFVEQVRDMNALATSQAFIKTVVEQTDNQLFGQDINVNLPGTQRKLLLIVPGTVLAGVDLEQLTEDDIEVNEEERTISLTLPRASLLQEPSLRMDEVEAFSVEGIFRSNVNWEEGFEIAAEAQTLMEQEAIEQGVLIQAEENAARALTEFFEYAGYDAEITFE
ncbi:DUF4230 domain-containing protein [Jeotgalibacillus salarius]|uniref:DUF4230 domain-containing protein n=1 Tax=Jeotgalibacillus salarius TaxID=546023 RepID=A0A4Y8LTB6_9BACL|nr:DUF4230 domain-containing protein [Jeotgalibacillus salarius]TFE04205.1 DUF4230 domain-containing protein [Jeotgalibacillus salarius]